MKVPDDRLLAVWIRQLIRSDRLELFYQTEQWRALRAEVLEDLHQECQHCLAHGRVTMADCVHHVNEVRHRPDLALSAWYVDKHGHRRRNLVPLCNTCHNRVHEKLQTWQKQDKFTNEERW